MMGAPIRRRLALLLVAVACGESSAPDASGDPIERAVAYFETHVHAVDPRWANVFGYLHRRFGLELENADGELLHRVPESGDAPEMDAIFRRLVDPAAAVAPAHIAALESQVDRMTASALHCDRIPLPSNWPEVLSAATRAGGYALTHAALASQWTLEQGCGDAGSVLAVQREQVEALAALVAARETLATRYDTPTDLWIEATAMLHYLGEGGRVRAAWIDALRAAQRPEGGWPVHPDAPRADPHPTALALWVLLEQRQPDAPPIRWVP